MDFVDVFCKEQSLSGKNGDDTVYCGAKAAEGCRCRCPYEKKDIKIIDDLGLGKYRLMAQKDVECGDGVCHDFRIDGGVKKKFIEDIVEELKKTK